MKEALQLITTNEHPFPLQSPLQVDVGAFAETWRRQGRFFVESRFFVDEVIGISARAE